MKISKYLIFFIFTTLFFALLFAQQTHKVQKGDTLFSIAKSYNTTVKELKSLNKLSSDVISVGRNLIVESPPKPIYHKVKKGDTIADLAIKNKTTIAEIKKWNNLKSNTINIGKKLIVSYEKNLAKNENTIVKNVPESNGVFKDYDKKHIVSKGENLTKIARKYDVSVVALTLYNELKDTDIKVGQTIYIYSKPLQKLNDGRLLHTVQKGETISIISKNYGISIADLKLQNDLTNNNLKIGNTLTINTSNSNTKPLDVNRNIIVSNEKSKYPANLYISKFISSPLDDIRVSSEFGMRNGVKHKGIDLPAYHNAPIYTVLPGKVIFSGVQKGYGNVVIIQHTNTISTLYAHNDANLVKVNDIVFQGQMIGRIGKTGNTNAFHLHFEFRKNGIAVNPRELLESKVPIS